MKKFTFEREGQEQFYKEYLPLIDKELKEDDVLLDYTDGVVNGNLLEFKLKIDNLNTVLFQAIKYLSRMRINGESVPKNILLLSLNTSECYVYNSEDYLEWIEKQYFGGASVNNEGFVAGAFGERLDYSTPEGSYRLVELLREEEYIKIHIDESCIVGWAERYYRELSGSTKGDFIGDVENKVGGLGEIRNPIHFKSYIYPYEGETNEKFAYLLDKLNDKLTQKETGAFYTPEAYARKAYELVEMAIERVPEGNDYVIFDFCSGSAGFLVSAMATMIEDANDKYPDPKECEKVIKDIKANRLLGSELDLKMWTLACSNMILRSDGSSKIRKGDAFELAKTEEFQEFKATKALLNPPFSYTENGMPFALEALNLMEKGGLLAIIIQDSAGTGKAVSTNKKILENNTLLASIKMPGDLFQPSAGVQTSIYIIRVGYPHDIKKKVKFIDFSNDGYKRTGRGLRKIGNPDKRYHDLLDVYKYSDDTKDIDIVEATITLSGADWNYDQHKIIDTTPTEEDFMKTVGDFLKFEISQII